MLPSGGEGDDDVSSNWLAHDVNTVAYKLKGLTI